MVDVSDTMALYKLVEIEAKTLKSLATSKELSRLNFEELDAHKKTKCIYGQLTGNCISERAEELILKCCDKVYKPTSCYMKDAELMDIPKEKMRFLLEFNYFSPIEKFLYVASPRDQKILVDYLKGVTETLEFN